jgi:hypothetical protein
MEFGVGSISEGEHGGKICIFNEKSVKRRFSHALYIRDCYTVFLQVHWC